MDIGRYVIKLTTTRIFRFPNFFKKVCWLGIKCSKTKKVPQAIFKKYHINNNSKYKIKKYTQITELFKRRKHTGNFNMYIFIIIDYWI